MKTNCLKLCVVFFAGIFLILPASFDTAAAQNTQAHEPLTLTRAIQIAVEKNHNLKAARFQVKESESQIIQARSGLYPQVYFTETFNRTNNPMWAFGTRLNQGSITQADFDPANLNDPDAINNFATAISVDCSLWNGGQTWIDLKQAEKNREFVFLGLKRTRQKVIAKTATIYVGLLLAQKNSIVVEQALETARIHLKTVRSRFDSGFVVKSDLLRAQVRIAELKQDLLQAESQVKVARAMLNASMGVSDDTSFNLETPFERCVEIQGTIEEWIGTAMVNRLDLMQLQLKETMAQKEISKSRAEHLPSLNLFGTYEINSENFSDTADNYTLGAMIRVNLFSGRRISAKTESAKASLRQVKAFREGLDLGVRVQTRQAFLQAQSAWQQIQVARTAANQAKEGQRIVANRYKNGLLTIVSLLDAEVAHQQALTRHFKALHDYKVARINLALAVGTIDEDFEKTARKRNN